MTNKQPKYIRGCYANEVRRNILKQIKKGKFSIKSFDNYYSTLNSLSRLKRSKIIEKKNDIWEICDTPEANELLTKQGLK